MSVRAYLVTKHEKVIDGKTYVYEEEDYLWNNWSEVEIWNLLWRSCMTDYTNEDCVGYIEICYDAWECLKEDYEYHTNSSFGEEVYEVVNKHKDVFQKIDAKFKEGEDFVKINLY